ncbi:hypothetical protein [Priestia megaterium]|uniref:hypothetical protein n=1 Tax=Priestia megaterium TaxID=1404 RepID=UPI002FFDCD7E
MYQMRIFTLIDGMKREIEIKKGTTLQDELEKVVITGLDIFQMQLWIQNDKKMILVVQFC